MLDTRIRPLIDPALDAVAARLARAGVGADAVTLAGLAVGLTAACAIALGKFGAGLALILASRTLDGLDGAVARATAPTDRGGFLDIVCDYVFYAAIPLAFAVADPAENALPAAALLASFSVTCSSFLGFAALAAKRGVVDGGPARKSFLYSRGLIEGFETLALFVAMAAFPARFPALAWIGAALCAATVLQRAALAAKTFR